MSRPSSSKLDIFQECKVSEDSKVAHLVLDPSFDVHQPDRYGWTLLAIAARYGKERTVAALLDERQVNINQTNKHDKSTALYWASREGNVEMVQLLLRKGANPNKAKKNGLTPLLVAAKERQDAVLSTLLQDGSVHIDQTDQHQRTALHYACESEPRSTAFLLLHHGASNVEDKDGITPFHIVCRQKWEDVLDLLLRKIVAEGSTQLLQVRDPFDRLPIHYMVSLQFDQDKKRWRNPQYPAKFCLLSTLFELEKRNLKLTGDYPHKASYLIKDPYGHLPANQAVRFGSDHMVEMLTLADETNAIADNAGKSGYLPLHRALTISYQISKRVSIVELLLKTKNEHGFDDGKYHTKIIQSVRTPDPKGYYPLHLALHFSPSKKIIQLLLEADAQETGTGEVVTTPGPDGFLPIHTALVADDLDDEIVKMLIDYDTKGVSPLTREPKSRKLPIHFAFANSLPSHDQLKKLIDGDWEKKSVYMRDGNGSIALHHLLKIQTKEDDPQEVADLVKLLLFESEKQLFGNNSDVVPEDRYSPLVMIEDRETGMLPLHMAFKYGAPNEVIELLMQFENSNEKHSGPSLIVDKAGKLPLHHACENPTTDPAIIYALLAHSELDTIAAMDKHKNLPLFLALKLQHANAQLLNALLPDRALVRPRKSKSTRGGGGGTKASGRGGIVVVEEGTRSGKQATEFLDKLYEPVVDIELKDLLQTKIMNKTAFCGLVNVDAVEWLYRFSRIAEQIEDYKVNDAILATLDSQTTIDWLNTKSYSRWSVFLLMSDMYAHIAWIVLFIAASKAYLSNLYKEGQEDYNHFGILLLFIASYFLVFRELIELFGNDTLWTYLKDPWNWFENVTIGCVIASGVHFCSPIGNERDIEALLVTTGLFQFTFAVSFLRTTFLAYAQFVGGILNIFYELIPFFLVTALILMAFSYAAYVQNFNNEVEPGEVNEFEDFLASFLTLFGGFLGGPERPQSVADILFGIISVVILLNVVIAIISNAWDDSTEETTIRFWEYRLGFIEEVAYTKEVFTKPVHMMRRCMGQRLEVEQKPYHNESAILSPRPPSGPTEMVQHPQSSFTTSMRRMKYHLELPHDDNKPKLSIWEKIAFFLLYLFLLLLGLCSFGQAWPKRIRKDVFGRNKRTVVLKKEDDSFELTKLDGIHRSVEKLSGTKMEERVKKVETEMHKMQGTMEEVHEMLKKMASQQLDTPRPE